MPWPATRTVTTIMRNVVVVSRTSSDLRYNGLIVEESHYSNRYVVIALVFLLLLGFIIFVRFRRGQRHRPLAYGLLHGVPVFRLGAIPQVLRGRRQTPPRPRPRRIERNTIGNLQRPNTAPVQRPSRVFETPVIDWRVPRLTAPQHRNTRSSSSDAEYIDTSTSGNGSGSEGLSHSSHGADSPYASDSSCGSKISSLDGVSPPDFSNIQFPPVSSDSGIDRRTARPDESKFSEEDDLPRSTHPLEGESSSSDGSCDSRSQSPGEIDEDKETSSEESEQDSEVLHSISIAPYVQPIAQATPVPPLPAPDPPQPAPISPQPASVPPQSAPVPPQPAPVPPQPAPAQPKSPQPPASHMPSNAAPGRRGPLRAGRRAPTRFGDTEHSRW